MMNMHRQRPVPSHSPDFNMKDQPTCCKVLGLAASGGYWLGSLEGSNGFPCTVHHVVSYIQHIAKRSGQVNENEITSVPASWDFPLGANKVDIYLAGSVWASKMSCEHSFIHRFHASKVGAECCVAQSRRLTHTPQGSPANLQEPRP